jgi:hypothetical protein
MDCRYVRLLRVENPSAVHGRTNMLNAGRLLMCLAPLYISLGGELVWAICTACTCNIQQQNGIHIACNSWICIQDDRKASKLYLLTYSTEHSPPWEVNRFSAGQNIPRILWNPHVHRRIQKCPPLVPILSKIDPAHVTTTHFMKNHFNIILLSMPGSSKWFHSLRFPHQNPVHTSPLPHSCYMPRPSNSSRFDHPDNNGWGVQVFKLPSYAQMFSSEPDSQTPSVYGPPSMWATKFHTLTKHSCVCLSLYIFG